MNTRSNFRFPISFEENELLDEKILSNQNVLHRQKEQEIIKKPSTELYSKKTTPEEKVTFFKVSPVISPVYGILDKNYKKDEVLSKTKKPNEIKRTSKNVDFESVRKKAYGSLIDDIKDNLSPVKIEEKKEDKKIEGIYELNEDISQITLGEIESNFEDFGISFEDYNKKEEKDDNIKIVSFDEKETVAEKIEINDSVIKSNKQEDDFEETKEEDIFNLIDSMMKKEEEENND